VCVGVAIIQETHSAVRALGFLPEDGHGVYVGTGEIPLQSCICNIKNRTFITG